MFYNVMVPVDGSSFSREAVLQGLRLASLYGATLRLVRVASTTPFSAGTEAAEFDSGTDRGVHAEELADLYKIAAECRAHSTISVTASLERGPIVDALCGYARRNNVDVIVMRSHARSGLARIWFGSVADALIRESGLPVIVVRPPSVSTAVERGFSFKRIMVPLDGSVLAEQALPRAVSLARLEGAMIVLVLIVPGTADSSDGTLVSADGPASERDVASAKSYLDSIAARYRRGVRIMTRVLIASDVPSAILGVADDHEIDMIAMATRGQGMMKRSIGGSVSDRVMRESTTSTLIIHPIAREITQFQAEISETATA